MEFKNLVCINGSINPDAFFAKFMNDYAGVMRETALDDSVTFAINSSGGDTHTAVGIFDIIKQCGKRRATVGIVCGRAESGGSLILQACHERVMTSSSVLMLHKSTVNFNGTIHECTQALEKFNTLEGRFFSIYATRSGKTIEEIKQEASHGRFFSSTLALEFGLIDRIL